MPDYFNKLNYVLFCFLLVFLPFCYYYVKVLLLYCYFRGLCTFV